MIDRDEDGYPTEAFYGELLTLPRPAVVLLNTLDPQPGEEITICKHWSGRPGEKAEWTVSLSPRSENTRAEAEKLTQEPAEPSGTTEPPIPVPQTRVAPPTPIRRPIKSRPPVQAQPRLFDRGTGTHGPAPAIRPELAPAARRAHPGQHRSTRNSRLHSIRPEHGELERPGMPGFGQHCNNFIVEGGVYRTMAKDSRMIPYGTRVKYSEEWLANERRNSERAEAKRGTVITRRMSNERCERVQWDDTAQPETISRFFLAPVEPADIALWERTE